MSSEKSGRISIAEVKYVLQHLRELRVNTEFTPWSDFIEDALAALLKVAVAAKAARRLGGAHEGALAEALGAFDFGDRR